MDLLSYRRFLLVKGWRAIIGLGVWAAAGLVLAGCVSGGAAANGGLAGPTATLAAPPAPADDGLLESRTLQPSIESDKLPVGRTSLSTPAPTSGAGEAEQVSTTVPTPTATFDPAGWSSLPVLPELSQHALSVLEEGIALGNNPRAFSKIGDCESRTTWFLGDFDLDEQYYSLGPYEEELAPVIEHYRGSFNRLSQAAKPGFTAASLLSPIWADRQACEKGESPLACEYRLHRPVMAFIMIGTNDAVNPKTFEGHMRKVIEISLEHRVLPVLGTKADNIEGDHAINATMARLAYEYDVPLWNYWLAVQDLPGHGLQEDGAHLTFAAPHFDNPAALKKAWPVRNLNALQILSHVMVETRSK